MSGIQFNLFHCFFTDLVSEPTF